jgi:hypothetical protein
MRLLDKTPWQVGVTPRQWTFLFEVNIDRRHQRLTTRFLIISVEQGGLSSAPTC